MSNTTNKYTWSVPMGLEECATVFHRAIMNDGGSVTFQNKTQTAYSYKGYRLLMKQDKIQKILYSTGNMTDWYHEVMFEWLGW